MTIHRIYYRNVLHILSIVALLMIPSINTGQLALEHESELRASTIVQAIDCGTFDSHSLSNPIPMANDGYDFYIGNRNTKILHSPSCAILPPMGNRRYFKTYCEAIEAGYRPCCRCFPI